MSPQPDEADRKRVVTVVQPRFLARNSDQYNYFKFSAGDTIWDKLLSANHMRVFTGVALLQLKEDL